MPEEKAETNVADAISKPPKRRNRTNEEMQAKLKIAREITQMFNMERYVYIACCSIAVALLLTNAGIIIWTKNTDFAPLSLLFGASGLITYSIGRLIYMWNKLVDLIISEVTERGEN